MGQQNVLQRQHGVLGEELYVLGLRNPDSGRHQFQTRRAGRQVPVVRQALLVARLPRRPDLELVGQPLPALLQAANPSVVQSGCSRRGTKV